MQRKDALLSPAKGQSQIRQLKSSIFEMLIEDEVSLRVHSETGVPSRNRCMAIIVDAILVVDTVGYTARGHLDAYF